MNEKENYVVLTVTMPLEMRKDIKIMAAKLDISTSELVRNIIQKEIQQYKGE